MPTVDIHVNAAGDETNLTPFGAVANWDCVDEVIADDGATYVRPSVDGLQQRDLYNLPDWALGSAVINSVNLLWRAARYTPGVALTTHGHSALKTHGVVYEGAQSNITSGVWGTRNTLYALNPNTGVAWTTAEIDALQVGVALMTGSVADSYPACTQVYITVDYTLSGFLSRLLKGVGL